MVANIVSTAVWIYSWTIIVYILLSWFQTQQWAHSLRVFLEPVVEPYVGIFRRIVPPMGMLDLSPLVALLVLQFLIGPALVALARLAGL